MTQTSKKTTHASPKLAASKLATEATENVVKIGGKAVKDFMSTSAQEAQKAQEKVFALSREGAENFAKSADVVTKALYEVVELSRDSVETCIECANLSAALAKDVSTELFESTNKAFSDNVELSKDLFACRTLSDMFELQNRLIKSSVDNFFNQSVKLSGMMFEYSSEALEPINEHFAQSADQLTKILSGNK